MNLKEQGMVCGMDWREEGERKMMLLHYNLKKIK